MDVVVQKGMKERKRDTTPKTVVERQVDGRRAGRGRIGSGDREGVEQRNPLAGSEEEQYSISANIHFVEYNYTED